MEAAILIICPGQFLSVRSKITSLASGSTDSTIKGQLLKPDYLALGLKRKRGMSKYLSITYLWDDFLQRH